MFSFKVRILKGKIMITHFITCNTNLKLEAKTMWHVNMGFNKRDFIFSFWRSHLSCLTSHDCKMDPAGRAIVVHRSKLLRIHLRSRLHLPHVRISGRPLRMGIGFLRHRLPHHRLVRVLVAPGLRQPRKSSQNFKVRKGSDRGLACWQRGPAKKSSRSLEKDLDLDTVPRPHGHRHVQLVGHHRPRYQRTHLPEVHAGRRHQDERARVRPADVVAISRRRFSFSDCRLASKASPDFGRVDQKNFQFHFAVRAGDSYAGQFYFFVDLILKVFLSTYIQWKYLINYQ